MCLQRRATTWHALVSLFDNRHNQDYKPQIRSGPISKTGFGDTKIADKIISFMQSSLAKQKPPIDDVFTPDDREYMEYLYQKRLDYRTLSDEECNKYDNLK